MNEKYRAILLAPRPVSENRKHMPRLDRAAQFAAFAALSGFGDAVGETARVTDERPELLEDEKREIDAYLRIIEAGITAHPTVGLTVFVPDARKKGGKLKDIVARAARIKKDEGAVVFENGASVPIGDIVSIEPALREGFEFRLNY